MDDNWVLRMPWAGKAEVQGPETLLAREWLVTNGLGGYACGTIGGARHQWIASGQGSP